MRLALALAGAAVMTAGCHRQVAADVTLDADADARNATEAKIDADLAAADAAARAPLPHVAPRSTPPRPEPAESGLDRDDDNSTG